MRSGGDGDVGTVSGRVNRRTLLGAGAATLLFGSACAGDRPAARELDLASLLVDDPFYLAHKGGSGDWPEMTAYAYDQAARLPGLKAMDLSVCRTADGVLVCSYDKTTKRLTGKDLTILDEDWATLSRLTVKATETSSPNQPRRPFARLEEVLDAHLSRFTFFIEPRVQQAAGNLMAQLISYDQPERIVWKQPVTSTRFAEAKRHGFATWGYVLDEPAHLGDNLRRYAASGTIDMLGVGRNRSDKLIAQVVKAASAVQKPVIAWDVRTARERARVLELGCRGVASSEIRTLLAAPVTPEPRPAER
jgi:glycerophosphoryl diester phosphodiesterase